MRLIFPPGSPDGATMDVSFEILEDMEAEMNESIEFSLFVVNGPAGFGEPLDHTVTIAGDEPPGMISGIVWMDENRNGFREADESGFSDITVRLFATVPSAQNAEEEGNPFSRQNLEGGAFGSTETGADGTYNFSDIPPGTYFVEFERPTNPAALIFSPKS